MSSSCQTAFPADSTRQSYANPKERLAPHGPQSAAHDTHTVFLGQSPAVRHLRSQVERIAPYFRTALIRGERGSGKRLIAEALHRLGPGPAAPFVQCSTARLTAGPVSADALLESARGGTLFLEEVGTLSGAAQAALVQLLVSREPVRAAASRSQRTSFANAPLRGNDVRVIASTVQDLKAMANMGQFRSDLYVRLSPIEIVTPPLRERTDDLAMLARCMLEDLSRTAGQPLMELSPAAVRSLAQRPWPGNLNELYDVLSRAAALAETTLLEPEDLPHPVPPLAPTQTSSAPQNARPDRLQDVIQQHVLDVLARCGGNKLRTAELLGISRSTLYRMLDAGAASSVQLDTVG